MKQTNSLEILVVGGCHVLGYPLGPSQGFPDQLASLLSESTSFASIGHLKLSHGRKVLDTVNRLRPEVLILQVGHFELTNGGSSYSTKKLSLERSSSKSTHYPQKSGFQTRTGRFKWHLRCAIKALANIVVTRWKVDLLQLEAEFTSVLYEVAQCDCSRIIILSPLPCADPILHHLRRQAGSCFKSVRLTTPKSNTSTS